MFRTVATVLGGHSKRLHTERSTQPERRCDGSLCTIVVDVDRSGRGHSASHGQHMRVFAGTAPVSRVARWMTLQRSSVIHMFHVCAMPWMIRYSTVCAPTQHQFVVTYANGPLPRAVPPYRERNLRATTEHSMLVLPNTPCWC